MKTNKLPRKGKFDAGLTIAGWVLAVFVSFLYLHEVTGSEEPPTAPRTATTANLNLEPFLDGFFLPKTLPNRFNCLRKAILKTTRL